MAPSNSFCIHNSGGIALVTCMEMKDGASLYYLGSKKTFRQEEVWIYKIQGLLEKPLLAMSAGLSLAWICSASDVGNDVPIV